MGNLEHGIAAKCSEIQRLEDELNRVNEAHRALGEEKARLQDLQQNHENAMNERNETVRLLTEQLSGYAKRISELQSAMASSHSDIECLEDELSRMQHANLILAEEKAATQRDHESIVIERNETVRQLTEQLSDYAKRSGELESAIAARHADIENLEDELARIEQANLILAEEKANAEREGERNINGRNETIRQLTEQLSDQARRAGDFEDQLHRIQQANLVLTNQNDVSRSEMEHLRDELHHISGTSDILMEENITIRRENERLVRDRNERESLIERKERMIHELEERVAQLRSDQEARADRTAEALQQLSCEIALQREDSRAMVETCRNLALSIEQLAHVVRAQASDTARLRDNLRLEISEIEEPRRVKYTAMQPVEEAKQLGPAKDHHPKFELVSETENTIEMPDLEGLLRRRHILVETLRRQPSHSVTVIPISESGKHGFNFAIELQDILESAGWSVGFMTTSFEANQYHGLHIVTDGSDLAASASRILSDAFRKGKLGFTETVAAASNGLDPVRVVVGIESVGLTVTATFR
jgi:chromosome segregation ATPase